MDGGEVRRGAKASRAVWARAALLVVGVALFAPLSSYRLSGEMFIFGHEPLYNPGDVLEVVKSLLLVMLGAALAVRPRFETLMRSHLRPALGATCVLLACALFASGAMRGGGLLEICICVLDPLYKVLLAYAWASCAQTMPPARAGVCLAGGILLSVLLIAVAQFPDVADGLSRSGRTVLLTLASGALWCALPADMRAGAAAGAYGVETGAANTGAVGAGGGAQDGPVRPRVALREPEGVAALVFAVFLLTTTVVRSVYSIGVAQSEYLYKTDLSKWLLIAIAALMFVLTALFARRDRRAGADAGRDAGVCFPWMAFIALCFGTLYFAIVFFDDAPFICQAVIFPSRMYAFYLTWLAGVAVGLRLGMGTGRCACLFWAITLGATRLLAAAMDAALAWLAVETGMHIDGLLLPATVLSAACTTVAAAAYLVVATSARTAVARTGARMSADDARKMTCERIGKRCGLSAREVQVLDLLSRGYSYRSISEALCLSNNTVTSYVKTLYRKTGFHDKQEIIALVNDGLAEAEAEAEGRSWTRA